MRKRKISIGETMPNTVFVGIKWLSRSNLTLVEFMLMTGMLLLSTIF